MGKNILILHIAHAQKHPYPAQCAFAKTSLSYTLRMRKNIHILHIAHAQKHLYLVIEAFMPSS
jgi:hypothetical protein